jgi:hypothetical protein
MKSNRDRQSRRVRSQVIAKLRPDELASLNSDIRACRESLWGLFQRYGVPAGIGKTSFYDYAAKVTSGAGVPDSILPQILDHLAELLTVISGQLKQSPSRRRKGTVK